MDSRFADSRRITALLFGLSVLLAAPVRADIEAPASTVASSQKVWTQSVRQITAGDFSAAAAHIDELAALGPGGERVAGWLRDLTEMDEQRAEATRQDREKYIGWAKEQHAKGNLENALAAATRALDNSTDKDALRSQPWMTEIYNDALAKAATMRDEQKWLDAHAVYYQLAEIFEHDKELQKLRHQCLTHARLEVTYKPEGKWEDYLAGIEWRMVDDALWKIDKYYVTDADFRELTVAGLEQLILLGESPALREVFDSLTDKMDRDQFIGRLQKKIDQTREMSRFSRRDAQQLFRRALDINLQTVQLPESLIVSEYMGAAMETLDEFSSVIWPVEFREFDKHTRGDFIGVGISIQRANGQITVVTPLEDSPAYHAGIQADDVITKVDGQSTEDMSLTQAVETITGPIDTSVTLTIKRPGVEKELELTLKRAKVTIQSVKGYARVPEDPQQWEYMVDDELGIGYVRVVQFASNTVSHLYEIISDLQKNRGLKGLILDLRFNPGGLLNSAVNMSTLFLERDDRIVSTKGERVREWAIDAEETGPFSDLPLVVLINEQSASASEIVSGALKDHGRATIIGERTFGKFSVQNLMQLGGTDAHLKLTTAAYYLPSGKSLHHTEDATEWGVDPSIQVHLVPKEMGKIWSIRRKSDVLARPDLAAASDDKTSNDGADAGASDAAAGDEADQAADKLIDTEVEPAVAKTDADGADTEDGETEEEYLPDDPNERPEIDPQLETALFVLRVQLLGSTSPQVALQMNDIPKVEVK